MLKSVTSLVVDPTSNTGSQSLSGSCLTGDSVFDSEKRRERSREIPNLLNRNLHSLQARNNESQILRDTYQRVRESGKFACVFVRGEAGTGKTHLVETTLRSSVAKDGAFFVGGKFDQTVNNKEPYPALAACFSEICDLVMQQTKQREILKKALVETMGEDDLKVLSRLVSGVSHLTGVTADTMYRKCFGMGQAFVHFKRQCKAFLKTLTATLDHPVVMFLDDLQFGDEESIEVIGYLIECDISNFLLIGSYRTSEDGEHKALLALVDGIVTNIEVKDLRQEAVNGLVSDILELCSDETESLSSICYQKTAGNPLAILQYLQLLESEGLLEYSKIENRWTWDDAKVQSETNISGNILELLAERVQHLETDVREVLKLASCLGFVFEIKILQLIVRELLSESVDLQQSLTTAAEQGFIERASSRSGANSSGANAALKIGVSAPSYKWSHDRIHQSLGSQMTSEEQEKMHLAIGKSLLANKNNIHWTSNLKFLAVDQFNQGVSRLQEQDSIIRVVEMNLEAGELSMARSAFAVGRKYFHHGVSLLQKQKDSWTSHYDLTLKVFNSAAQAAHSTGCAEIRHEIVEAILFRGTNLNDKLLAYHIRVDALGNQGTPDDALDAGQELLVALGERFPRRPHIGHVVMELARTKIALRNKSNADFMAHPLLQDNRVYTVMKFLSTLHRSAFHNASKEFIVLLSLRLMRLSLRYGVCEFSTHAFASYAIVLASQRQYEEAHRYGKLAVRLMMKIRSKEVEARTLVLVYALINHCQRPIDEGTEHFRRAYQSGLSVGEVGFAMLGALNYCFAMYHTGVPLEYVEDQLQGFCGEMRDFGEENALSSAAPLLQAILNLMGRTADPVSLSGEIMDEEATIEKSERTGNDAALLATWIFAFGLACYFGAWSLAADYLDRINSHKSTKNVQVHFMNYKTVLFSGLCYFANYRLTGIRLYKVKARRIMKKIERDVSKGVVTYVPILKFLQAEELSLAGDFDETLEAYNAAVHSMEEDDLVHYAALTCEMGGNAVFDRFGNRHEAAIFYDKASQLYSRWNAQAKVDHIEERLSLKC